MWSNIERRSMIIDCHGHYTTAPRELEAYRQRQIDGLNDPSEFSSEAPKITDDQIRASLENAQLEFQRERGTDLTIFSPRAMGMGHHIGNAATSLQWSRVCNDLIYRVCSLYPENFAGVCQLPQSPGVPPVNCITELARCVEELGFVGCNLNPDPSGGHWSDPPLGDRFWYPLYEKMVELDIPGHIHSTGCRSERLSYSLHFINEENIAVVSLLNSNVYKDFPTLKIMVSHGGGAIPYQFARFEAGSLRRGGPRFSDMMRNLYYDTVLYSADALALLFKTVGADRCLFGTERPGIGTVKDPKTGKWLDETRHIIEGFEFLSAAEKKM